MILRFYRRKGFQRVEVSELPEDLVTGTNSWAPVAETLVRSMGDEAQESARLPTGLPPQWLCVRRAARGPSGVRIARSRFRDSKCDSTVAFGLCPAFWNSVILCSCA